MGISPAELHLCLVQQGSGRKIKPDLVEDLKPAIPEAHLRKLFLSRLTKMILVLAVVLVGPGLMAASADTIFTFSGTFLDGSALGGTLTINTATGAIDGIDLTVGANTFTFQQGSLITIGGSSFIQLTTTPGFSFPLLDLFFPVSSLVGYTGGQLCISPVSGGCADPTQYGSNGTAIYLTQGSSSTGSSVPEPSSLLLLTGGLIGLGLLSRKMLFANGRA
jgi:PEP-CTERM motif